MKHFLQVIKYGWEHAGQIAIEGRMCRMAIFFDIVCCFCKYKMWSNQYLVERFWEKSKEERQIIGANYFEKGKIRDDWQRDFQENNEFLIEYTQMKYERARLREKRNKAYSKRYNAKEGLFVEYNVVLSRQHYLPGSIKIGKNVLLAKNVFIDYSGNVIIEDKVKLTNGVVILSHYRDMEAYKQGKDVNIQTNIRICENAFIGTRAIILPSCHYIGKNAQVGAGAVVTKDVPDNTLVAGVPAKVIRIMEH